MTDRSDAFGETSATRSGEPADRADHDTEEIREQIKDTRSRMSDTLDQLGERLNPHRLGEQVKDSIRDATVGRVSHMARQAKDQVMSMERSLVRTARENPVPAAMIGIGLAWIILNNRRRGSSPTNGYSTTASQLTDYDEDAPNYGTQYETLESEEESGIKRGLHRVRDQAAELGGTIKEKVAAVGERTSDMASKVGERTSEIASKVGERTSQFASKVGQGTKRMATAVAEGSKRQAKRVEETFYENPLAIGALALAAGLAVGLSVPRTETESRLMGDASERLTDKARDVVRDTKDKVQHVAERVIEEGKRTANDAMREQGLTSRA